MNLTKYTMFKKKQCPRCREKISDKHKFCPGCGASLNQNYKEGDYGMLGQDDFEKEFNQFSNSLFGGGMLGKMLGNAMKMLEKEIQKEMKNPQFESRSNVELFINGKRVDPNKIKFTKIPMQQKQIQKQEKSKKIDLPFFSKEKQKQFAKLPRKEPTTNVRRLADRVIYELTVPGVNSVDNVSIVQVGESIEIKTLAKTKAYFKSISISLPIINYFLEKGKLVLELANN